MGKREGRKVTRKVKLETRNLKLETAKELPPLSEDGRKVALGVAPLTRIEEIRRA